MRFGIVSIFPPGQESLERLRLAERLGFDNFWVCDSHVIWNECYSMLGYLVAQSRDPAMQFGTMVTNPVTRDPVVVASAFATLRQLAGEGRLVCGIGRGDSSVHVVRRRPAKLADVEAAFRIIHGLTAGETVTIDERTEVVLPWVQGAPVPVYGAAVGPRTLEAVGRSADGVIIECADPHFIAWAVEQIRRAADAVGRDLSGFAVVSSTATYISDDMAAAREKVRPFGAVIGNNIAETLRNAGQGSLPPEFAAFTAKRSEYDYYKHVHTNTTQANYVPDEAIDRLCVIGPLERCAERVEELRSVGVTHLNFYAQTEHYDEHMELYAKHVLPKFQGADSLSLG